MKHVLEFKCHQNMVCATKLSSHYCRSPDKEVCYYFFYLCMESEVEYLMVCSKAEVPYCSLIDTFNV